MYRWGIFPMEKMCSNRKGCKIIPQRINGMIFIYRFNMVGLTGILLQGDGILEKRH